MLTIQLVKLLLNSLYGRLGMNHEIENHKIISNEEDLILINNFKITNVTD